MTDTNAEGGEYPPQVVRIGFDGATVPMRFCGREIHEASNHSHEGPNQNRWHDWTLYRVAKGYRVLDAYHTQWQGEAGHSRLSRTIDAKGVALDYPALMHSALEAGVITEAEAALDADAGEGEVLEAE